MKDTDWNEKERHIIASFWKTSATAEEIGIMCGQRSKNAVISQAARMRLGPKATRGNVKVSMPIRTITLSKVA